VAARNWTPFVPANTDRWGHFDWSGILRAAGVVFFAYIGFDAVSTTAQEARNPRRDMPIGILGSLGICTLLYVLVSGVLTALVPYAELNVAEPIAVGMRATGYRALAGIVKLGAIAGLSSVMLVMLMGQPRIFFAMSHDGLLPSFFGRVHPRFGTPATSTVLAGSLCSLVAGALPLSRLGELVSIGTLMAFAIVCASVWFLRVKEPERPRAFRTPFVPLVPLLGIAVCLARMIGLPVVTWIRLGVWLTIGLVVYFGYGRRHSHLRRG
jgi:APA family basic amino acid/polyamine antiporter